MPVHHCSIDLGTNRQIIIETGKLAGLAAGAVTVRQGDTVVLIAACAARPRPGLDFFPLQVDYRERFSAAGRVPGGYFKREGRPTEKEILTSRMTDRPIRALFPDGYIDDVQVMGVLLSADAENDPDVLCMLGASAALTLSALPFEGPLGALRVGRIKGQFVANPTHTEMKDSDLDLVYAGLPDKVIMIEGGGAEISEEVLADALRFADDVVKRQVAAQQELRRLAGKPKATPTLHLVPPEVQAQVRAAIGTRFEPIKVLLGKAERQTALDALFETAVRGLIPGLVTATRDEAAVEELLKKSFVAEFEAAMRRMILDEGRRLDGRSATAVRQLSAEVGVLPRTHGSALFARGETQALVSVTLGSGEDVAEQDAISGGAKAKTFYLHYNFPNFSVGETGRIGGPGRREIGHGALAERSLARLMPKETEQYPYTVRCVADIMSSNGSTSMASICGGSLALMDAGVPLKKPVAGISCGLVTRGDQYVLLTDIIGAEDHYGDMDFKVAGTADGITGFQLDLKIAGVAIPLLAEALQRNKTARLQILAAMNACLAQPRPDISPFAPRIQIIKINPEKIGAVIGPGGSVIRQITSTFDVEIDIEDDGSVKIFAADQAKAQAAILRVMELAGEAEVGKIYHGTVVSVREFGAFVEIMPGQDGLLHISELANYRVNKVEDVINVGDKVTVKCIAVDERGRVRLSRKAALEELEK